MKFDKVRKIVDGVIENEFRHVEEFLVKGFEDNDIEYKKESAMTQLLYEKLEESLTEEQKDLLDNLYSAMILEGVSLGRFYFKEGVRSGLTNLKFLDEINYIGTII